MENRKKNYSPRDRVDEDFLLRLLNEDEVIKLNYGRHNKNTRSRASAGSGNGPYCNICAGDNRDTSVHNGSYRDHDLSARKESSSDDSNKCGSDCSFGSISFPWANTSSKNFSYAMAYVMDHGWGDLYEDEEALSHGTLFRVLDFPFYPTPCNHCN